MNKINRHATAFVIFISLGLFGLAQADQPCGNNSGGDEKKPPAKGDPYDPYTGNEYREIQDLKVWGGVGEHQLTFGRWANSRFVAGAQYFGDGHNWRHSYQWDIADAAPASGGNAQIEIIAPEGSDTIYTQNSTNPAVWNPPASTTESLTQSGNDFYLQRKNGFRYHLVKSLNTDGSDYYQMTDFTDTQENDYALSYNAAHEVTQVTEPGGRYLQVNYTTANLSKVDFTTLATITTQPAAGQYTTVTVTNPTAYRYLRYFSPDSGYCDVAEVQFYDTNGNLLAGTPFGTGTNFGNAFDGDTSTANDDPSHASGGYCGIDLGPGNSAVVGSIRYYPRAGYESRMMPPNMYGTPGQFQGSNQAPATVDVVSSVSTSDGRTVNYQYTPFNDATLPSVYQTLTAVAYDDGTQASYTYNQVLPSTPPLVTAYNDPRYPLPFKQSQTVYYTGVDQALGEINQQLNPQTGEAVSTLTSNGPSQPIVTSGNGAVRAIAIYHTTGAYTGMTDGAGAVTSVAYDGSGFRNSFKDGLGRITARTNSPYAHPVAEAFPDGSTISIPRDSLDLPTSVTDELGHTTTISRDSNHRPVSLAYPDGSAEAFTYNSFGQPLTHTQRNGGTASAVYDSTGLKTSSTDAQSDVTTYTYDSMGRMATATDALGRTTSYQYNAKGQVTQITYADGSTHGYTYDAYGNKLTDTNELGNTTTYTYDVYNRCTSITDALGRTTQFVFRSGYWTTKPDQMIEPSGKVTAYTYDGEAHLLSVTVGYGTADAATTSYAYDANYNVLTMTDGNGHAWTFTYDQRNRKLSQTDPLGHTTSYAYDAAGNVTKVTRPDGGVTTNVYDTTHHVTQTTDPKGEVTTMTYDHAGNLLTTTDARGHTYSYTYDLLNRKTSLHYPDGSAESYAYDAVGNLVSYTTRAGQTKTSVFDSRNREVSFTWSDGTPGASRSYDAAGRLLSSGNGVSTSTYTYDSANQMRSETQTNATVGTPWTVAYSYDADGNRTSVTYPSGKVVTYDYTSRNQVYAIGVYGTSWAEYAYDGNGHVVRKDLADGTAASYSYDAANRLTTLNHTLGGTSFARFDYGYDSVNRRTYEKRNSAKGDVYTYDAVDQVASVNYNATNPASGTAGANKVQGFTYDAVGNRAETTDSYSGNSSYTANADNEYTAVNGAVYTYGLDGNMLTMGNAAYAYDADNRMTSALVGIVTADDFSYDSRNRVVERTVNGVATFYIYDGWDLIEERNASGTVLATYVHGVTQDEMLSRTTPSGTVFYHANGLGSVSALTNSTGAVVEKYTYDAFGAPAIYNGSGTSIAATAYGNRFLFTGREYLAELKLYDYRNRVYCAGIGRFLQTDPERFSAGDVNIYRYCGNNPLNLIDPTGESFWGSVGNVLTGAASGAVGGAITGAITGFVLSGFDPAGAAAGALAGAAAGAIAGGIAAGVQGGINNDGDYSFTGSVETGGAAGLIAGAPGAALDAGASALTVFAAGAAGGSVGDLTLDPNATPDSVAFSGLAAGVLSAVGGSEDLNALENAALGASTAFVGEDINDYMQLALDWANSVNTQCPDQQ